MATFTRVQQRQTVLRDVTPYAQVELWVMRLNKLTHSTSGKFCLRAAGYIDFLFSYSSPFFSTQIYKKIRIKK